MDKTLHVPEINRDITITLNIGLGSSLAWGANKVNSAGTLHDVIKPIHDYSKVRAALFHTFPIFKNMTGTMCKTGHEDVVVVQFTVPAREAIGNVFALADLLGQDCVAVWIHNDTVAGGIGHLIGRYNYIWGEFNKEYFHFMPDGDKQCS